MPKSKNRNRILSKEIVSVLNYFKDSKKEVLFISISLMATSLIGIINPIIEANLVTSLTSFKVDDAITLVLILVAITILKQILSYIDNYLYLMKIQKNVVYNIRKDMINNILEMKTLNYDKTSSGKFIERLNNDPKNIMSVLSGLQFTFFGMITDLFTIFYIFHLSIVVGLVYFLGLLLIYVYEKKSFSNQEILVKESNKINDKTSTVLNELLRGIRDVKILNINHSAFNLVSNSLEDSTISMANRTMNSRKIWGIINVMKSLISLSVVFICILLVKNNLLTVTNLLVIYMYRNNVFSLVMEYTSIKEHYINFKEAAGRIFELANSKDYPKESFGTVDLKNIDGKIEIKNLSFGYEKKKVLNNINLTINPNDTIGIVGASGSGKTTLLNLLIKSYYVDDNEIFIDDVDINKLSKDSIRNNISVISQNPYIFNLTIKENLQLMGENVKMDEITEACKIAQIHDYIMTLPKKYNTLLGEGGVNLSGGQRQRLAIARALIKKSKIILFDEATSALDNVTQKKLNKAIHNISDDYTIIIVAHRLSTIKDCSTIYVMEDGKIVGNGTHNELFKNNEIYKKLYNMELE